MEKLISVIIPVYNGEKLLGRALDSVIAQTCGNWELIIVDDGSTDGTADVIKRYSDRRIKSIFQENMGVSEARNTGIRNSSGDYVAFLDHDDFWHPGKLSAQVEALEKNHGAGLVYTDVFLVGEHGSYMGRFSDINSPYCGNVIRQMFMQNFVCTSSVLMEKSILDRTGLFKPEFRIAQDYDIFLRSSMRTDFFYIDKPLVYYDYSPSGLSADRIRMWQENVKLVDSWLFDFPELYKNLGVRTVRKKKSMILFFLGKEYMEKGLLLEARKAFFRALCTKFSVKSALLLLLSFLGQGSFFLIKIKRRLLK